MTAPQESTNRSAAAGLAIDAEHPWLGLASFTEESRAYFYGREDEVGELSRRVQRKLLTILFGQSGLGKTSILRAGVVPRLRAQGYCPVYVRIDYDPDAPSPAEQIKQAIFRAAQAQGQWSQTGVAVEGESLWEFLHHRDDVLRDAAGTTLLPLLIFDQFEEIFTLAQSDDLGRQRAARFIDDLADLVENRPPKELESRLDRDESALERFDFTRSDYRILIALREDYLAPLEGLKGVMPSITQNRMRLAPMTGTQALAAVSRPGGRLVSEEVSAAIVRFVAGGAEIGHAEVEPSLLSLICRELNDKRIAQGKSEISLDLLDGSHAGILGEFYERALADQPEAVRRFIEDELLTESGFRENVAEERVLGEFAAAGAAPDALATLVNRRLLRIEERLDIRRVELTHDVLCSFVKASRDLRHERESREATERLLTEQRDRARAARHALVRARQIAVVCGVLAAGALVAAIFAYASTERARRAERAAEESRIAAERARAQAEHLIGYLADDLSVELEGVGRLEVISDLGKQEVEYYASLPATLQSADTARNGALAQVRYGTALRGLGQLDEAQKLLTGAAAVFEKLQSGGDRSDATALGLALALNGESGVLSNQNRMDDALALQLRAVALAEPIADSAEASLATRRTYGKLATRLGYLQYRVEHAPEAVTTLEHAKRVLATAGARDATDIPAAGTFAEASGWEVGALAKMGRNDDARRVGAEGTDVATRVLELRPNNMSVLRARTLLSGSVARIDIEQMRIQRALEEFQQDEADGLALTKLDPGNVIARNNYGVALGGIIESYSLLGRPSAALRKLVGSLAPFKVDPEHADLMLAGIWALGSSGEAALEADLGDVAASRASIARATRSMDVVRRRDPAGPEASRSEYCEVRLNEILVVSLAGDLSEAQRLGRTLLDQTTSSKADGPAAQFDRRLCLYRVEQSLGELAYELRDFSAAERELRAALDLRAQWPIASDAERRQREATSVLLAMTLSRLNRADEGLRVIGPVVTYHRALLARNHDDEAQRLELAVSIYALALNDREHRSALLNEAATRLAALPAEMRALKSVRQWQERVVEAQTEASPRAGPAALAH